MKIKIKEYWFENSDLILIDENNQKHILKDPYISDIKFTDLDCESTENIKMVSN